MIISALSEPKRQSNILFFNNSYLNAYGFVDCLFFSTNSIKPITPLSFLSKYGHSTIDLHIFNSADKVNESIYSYLSVFVYSCLIVSSNSVI